MIFIADYRFLFVNSCAKLITVVATSRTFHFFFFFFFFILDSRKVQVNEKIGPSGYFRPESPWLAGTRKINLDAGGPVELKSVTTVSMVGTDKNPSLRVSDLSASWSGDKDKLVLEGINFKLDSVS